MNKTHFYLDKEKDIIVSFEKHNDGLHYVLSTPNHNSGNLISNLAKLCNLELAKDNNGLKIIKGIIPCYVLGNNKKVYIFRLGNTKVANIYPDGTIEMKANIPSISKTLMSQTKNYKLSEAKTIIKTYILDQCKFKSDLHTHMNANLSPDILIALGIKHQIKYPLYYIKKLKLKLSKTQETYLYSQRKRVERQYINTDLKGKYRERKIDDNTFINFADLILNNLKNADYNISKIRASLAILKDGQAVFTNLEKVYLYRYVFTKGTKVRKEIVLKNIDKINDEDIKNYLKQMLLDKNNVNYKDNTLFQDKLLWIARSYQTQGIEYVEISDTTLVKKYDSINLLKQVHNIMPYIEKETKVKIRFLAAIRRVPLTIIKDQITNDNYLNENINVLKAIAIDPYVVGCDIVGEEINDIKDLESLIQELTKITRSNKGFVIRIHAGENDGLTDNVYNSVMLIKKSLNKNQKMPRVRIGHGLYTPDLNSKKGKQLIKIIKENEVVLEFQISSNVRLNNLNSLDNHPLKQYLAKGIKCVQGSDGAAIYGTCSIDEQLSLEKLLDLSFDDLMKMSKTEQEIINESDKIFKRKLKAFNDKKVNDLEEYYLDLINKSSNTKIKTNVQGLDSNKYLSKQINELPWDRIPIVVAGGSFSSNKKNKLSKHDKEIIDDLLDKLDPQKVFFVIGHSLLGHEKYLVENNKKDFLIYAIVPTVLKKNNIDKLRKTKLNIRVSIESFAMGLYKSFNYEIFERRPSIVIAFDGNLSIANLVQEAKNGKGKAYIYVNLNSKILSDKASSLIGYVNTFDDSDLISKQILENINDILEK